MGSILEINHDPAWIWAGVSGVRTQENVQTARLMVHRNFDLHVFDGSANIHSQNDLTITSNDGTLKLKSKGKDVTLSSFEGSGALSYRFGPHESWHTGENLEFPIAHSGQVEEMIRKNISPFQSGVHVLGGDVMDFTKSLPVPIWQPYAYVAQLSGVFFSPIHNSAGMIRFDPRCSGLEISNDTGKSFYPIGQSITRTVF